MKVSGTVLALVLASTASAFTAAPKASRPLAFLGAATLESPSAFVDLPVEAKLVSARSSAAKAAEAWKKDPFNRIQVGRYVDKAESIAVPFLERPTKLDGTHAGDYGFDPMGFTEANDLYTLMESELRHGRLAMLAVVGWPLSELVAPDWMLQANGCAPSVLNGFNPITFIATLAFFACAGFFEYQTALRRVDNTRMGKIHQEDMANVWKYGVPGDYNFDPLNLYSCIGDNAVARKGLRDVEISHGRSAMVGITAFAAWEALTGHPIVENSMFFHPNLVLPALATIFVFATQVLEVDEEVANQYPLRLKVSSEGQARLENLQMAIRNGQANNSDAHGSPEQSNEELSKVASIVAEKAGVVANKVVELAKAKYNENFGG